MELYEYKTVIFDLDGTLIDSMGMWGQIDIDYLEMLNKPLPDDLQKRIEGMSFMETAYYFKETFEIEDSIETILKTWTRMAKHHYMNTINLKDGELELLNLYNSKSFKIGLATSNSNYLTEIILNRYDISRYFDTIITSDEISKGKPDPEIYHLALKNLNAQSHLTIAFEDTYAGVLASSNAGLYTIAVEDNFSKKYKSDIEKVCNRYIESFQEILK